MVTATSGSNYKHRSSDFTSKLILVTCYLCTSFFVICLCLIITIRGRLIILIILVLFEYRAVNDDARG